ncbi:unnamed protein product [Rangifer tarandus platyrhynchus]|uniref:Uncharacterized protein n=2 Tax=Rangifer tarandus platyrhynchus TaxID=3082113 RepID=A0ABN8ZMK7_RANTA|nr:unnamed protein product [Rangifer tarandus platyrhynchus]CAI9707007.1 unnamed protein product [Rangifer tarandus platyrhynchus]
MEGLERDVREKGWAVTFFGWTSEDSAKSHIISYTLKLEELAECTVSELWGWSCWGWRSVVGAEGVAEVEPAPERELRLMLRCCWPSRGSGPGAVPALGLKPALSLVVVLEPALDLTLVLRLTLGLWYYSQIRCKNQHLQRLPLWSRSLCLGGRGFGSELAPALAQ